MDTEALVAYVSSQQDGVLSTLGADGEPQAAYLPFAVTALGELVFDARDDSRKVANIRRDPRVAVVIGGPDGTTLQLQGVADEPAGVDGERCAAAYVAAFPDSSVGAPGIVVVRVRADWTRFGDYRPRLS
jgi:general stress protein 26